MPDYKLIDAEQLDSDLKRVADIIRAKANTSDSMAFPEEFISTIEKIVDTYGTNALAKHILKNKTAYVNGEKVTGTMPDNGDVSTVIDNIKVLEPYVLIPEGYTTGGRITITPEIRDRLEEWLYKNTDVLEATNATPQSIDALLGFLEDVTISSGDVTEKPYVDTSKIDNFKYFFYTGARLDILDKIDTSNGKDFTSMFASCKSLTTIPGLDIRHNASFTQMFAFCSALKTVPFLDTSKATNVVNMFRECTSLESVTITTVPPDLVMTSMFYTCTALKNLEIGAGWATHLYLQYSENLTQESLHGIIENLADLTGATAKVFSVGATNIAKIDEEHIAMLEAKNWTYS